MTRAGLALAMLSLPAAAEACATCISSPYGDRTYNWPYLLLILLPFGVALVISGVLARVNGVSVGALVARAARAVRERRRRASGAELSTVRQRETT